MSQSDELMSGNAATPTKIDVLGTRVDVTSYAQVIDKMISWGNLRQGRMVCVVNSHSLITAQNDSAFRMALECSDVLTPDGAPTAWMMRHFGAPLQRRVTGPDIMLEYCRRAEVHKQSIYLYGSTEQVLSRLEATLKSRFPDLKIAGSYSPPFRPLTDEEDEKITREINNSGAAVVWVGLGCPKQEIWMAEHRSKIHAVTVGVGAAFEFFSGTTRRAPAWMQAAGMEWAYRLIKEPRRLWRRYLGTNTAFIFGAVKQFMHARLTPD